MFIDGALLNVLNPKTAIFFLSFVPHFVDPGTLHPVRDLAALGAVFTVLSLIYDGAYAIVGGWVGVRLAGHHVCGDLRTFSLVAPTSVSAQSLR